MNLTKSLANFPVFATKQSLKAIFITSCLMSSNVYATEQGAELGNKFKSVFKALLAKDSDVYQALYANKNPQTNVTTTDQSMPNVPNHAIRMSEENQQLMAKGMWHDPSTGLIWMRCNVWQDKSWDGKSTVSQCAGTHDVGDNAYVAKHYIKKSTDWAENMLATNQLYFGGYGDWRLPTTLELSSIQRCQYYEAGSETPTLKPVKVDAYTSDSIRVSCEQPIYSGAEITRNPDVQELGVGGGLSTNLSSRGRPIHTEYQVGFSDGGNADSGSGFAVRGGQPDGVFTSNLIIAQKIIEDRYRKDAVNSANNKADLDRFETDKKSDAAKYKRELPAYLSAYKAKTARFRQTVQAGDYAVNGLVIQVNGNAILVQTTAGDKWINRNEILPSHY